MAPSTVALLVIFVIVAFGSVVGFLAGARRKMDLEQWTVGARGFGVVLLWLLMSGETYTTFSLLGASGWAFTRGAPALYILAYLTLGLVISFYLLPPVWELGRRFSLQTLPDFFQQRYQSPWLTGFVALIGVISIVPYLQLQLTGLGLIVNVASFDGIGRTAAMLIGCILVSGFVFAGGIRAVAWISVLKDLLLLFVVIFVGIAVPVIHFGGIGAMFTAVMKARPAHFVMPGSTPNLGHAWFISSVVLSACGFYMWPHAFGASYTAKSSDALRRNAVVMPLYALSLPFVFFIGFAAIVVLPDLNNGDLSFLTVARQTFPAWFLGVVGGAGALTAMVPAAVMLLTAATLFTKNLYRPLLAPGLTDNQVARRAKLVMLLVCLLALGFAIFSSTTLVGLLLMGYAGVTQFFPGVVLGLFWPRVSRAGVFAGLLTGVTIVAVLVSTGRDPFHGINAGFLALCANLVVTLVVSLVTAAGTNGFAVDAPVPARESTSTH